MAERNAEAMPVTPGVAGIFSTREPQTFPDDFLCWGMAYCRAALAGPNNESQDMSTRA